jgi:hypothetical protein
MTRRRVLRNFALVGGAAVLASGSVFSWGQTGSAGTKFQTIRYVRVDPVRQTALMFDEKFEPLGVAPRSIAAGAEFFDASRPLWLTAVQVDMARRKGGQVEIVSDDPAYRTMCHHVVMGVAGGNKSGSLDPCRTQRPVGTGKELQNWTMPEGYAYKIQGGYFYVWDAHFINPAAVNLGEEEVYVRFTLSWDRAEGGYIDTECTWVDAGARGCISTFCVPPGRSTKESSTPVSLRSEGRIVLTGSHTHNHALLIELLLNDKVLHEYTPVNSNTFDAHDDCGQGEVTWHKHEGHLPRGGMPLWAPGKGGPIVKTSDVLKVRGTFDNPHDRLMDEMIIVPVFWEVTRG